MFIDAFLFVFQRAQLSFMCGAHFAYIHSVLLSNSKSWSYIMLNRLEIFINSESIRISLSCIFIRYVVPYVLKNYFVDEFSYVVLCSFIFFTLLSLDGFSSYCIKGIKFNKLLKQLNILAVIIIFLFGIRRTVTRHPKE